VYEVVNRVMVGVAIETRLRRGELIALRPVDVDFTSHVIHVQRTIVEVARKNLPTGRRCFVKNYPKDHETRHVQIEPAACTQLRTLMVERGIHEGCHWKDSANASTTSCLNRHDLAINIAGRLPVRTCSYRRCCVKRSPTLMR
jgi:integrase